MKEQIDTIPVNDAFASGDECPFCFLERKAEQSTIRYVAGPGASYMEPEVRGATDAVGFCNVHTKKLYDYGNALGSALIFQTYYAGVLESLRAELEDYEIPQKKSLFKKYNADNTYWQKLREKSESCFICDRMEKHMDRYYRTFFVMLKDPEFCTRVENSKGFCLRHFARLMEEAPDQVPGSRHEWFFNTIPALMEKNLTRVKEDLDWLIAKYDYRNAGAPWNNSRDALQRAMQKMQGIHPADPVYKNE